MNRRRKKKDSAVKTVFLIFVAAIVMTAAVYVIISVVGKIRTDYEKLDYSTAEETTHIDIDTKREPTQGWYQSEQGWMYYLDKKNYVADQWMDIDGFLYYFGSDGLMVTGEWKQEGQIFTLHDTKGYLKDIKTDMDYVPENTGENLDSLVRTNAFWCYLDSEDGSGLFKTILYRKTVENKVMVLGGESTPEKTTRNSMRAYGDYVYYLPQVKESQKQLLSESEKGLCGKLFRMRPGSSTKELIADNVDGYLVLKDNIYYAQAGKIYQTDSGTEVAAGEASYSVIIKDDSCYLVDETGNPAVADNGNSISIGDRVYRIEEDGKIRYVKHGQVEVNGKTYYLSGSGAKSAVSVKSGNSDTVLIRENYGVQSYCIVDNQIYYSSYVEKKDDGQWYSQIFRADLEGQNKQPLSEQFPGVMQNLYYYEDEGNIYGEYNPAIWKQAYGVAAIISRDGTIYEINDDTARTGKHVEGNDTLEIVMAKDGKVICLWHDCEWSKSKGITSILWSKAIELDAGNKSLIDMTGDIAGDMKPEESSGAVETEPVIQPIGITPPSYGETMAPHMVAPNTAAPETIAPNQSSVNHDPIVSTERPHSETVAPAPTVPPVTEPSAEIKIVPLG